MKEFSESNYSIVIKGGKRYVCKIFDGKSPDTWTHKARQGFAKFLHFGLGALSGCTIYMLLRFGLVRVGKDARIVPDDLALSVWNAWVDSRLMKSRLL